MSETGHGLTPEDIEELQRITEEREKFAGEVPDLKASKDGRESAYHELERLTDEVGLTWVTANRVASESDLSNHGAGVALGDLHRLDLVERRGERSPYQYRLSRGL
jgi:hypothetical protein